jgi:hypothetical protein
VAGTGSSSGSSLGEVSTISGVLLETSTKKTPTIEGQECSASVANLNQHLTITAMDNPQVKIWDIIANMAPVKINDGSDMCLSFQL